MHFYFFFLTTLNFLTKYLTTNFVFIDDDMFVEYFLYSDYVGLPLNNASEKTPQNYDLCTKSDGVMCVYDDDENLVRLRLDDDDEEDNTDLTDIENFVFFLLYTRKNPLRSKPLYVDDEDALKRTKFDPALPTRFVTHGWMNSRKSAACTLIRDGMLHCRIIVRSVKLFSIGKCFSFSIKIHVF